MDTKRVITFTLIAILGFTLLLSGCGSQKTQQKAEKQHVPVEVAQVEKRDIVYQTTITGTVSAEQDVNIIPKIPGKVELVKVDVGDRVKKGDVLLQLEQDEIRAQLKQAEAALAMAKAGKSTTQSQFENARVNLERMQKLYSEGAISKQQLEQAKLQLDSANPESVEAQVKQAEAALESARFQLENTVITSPISGIVTAITTEVGEMVSQTMPVARIVNMDLVYIESTVTENQVNYLEPGQEVKVTIEAVSAEPLTGKIVSISPAADLQTKTYPVKIELENGQHFIKPGMFAEVSLPLAEKNGVVAVPMSAIVERMGKTGVFVVEDGKAVFREISKGLDNGEYVEVTGIGEGEKLVVEGQHSLTHNTEVKIAGRGDR